jgi:hypothetical protein
MSATSLEYLQERQLLNPFIAELRGDVLWVSDQRGTFEFETAVVEDDGWHNLTIDGHHEVVLNAWVDDVVPFLSTTRCSIYAVSVRNEDSKRMTDFTAQGGIEVDVKGG